MTREEITGKVLDTFKNNKKLCVQLPTGVGKSLIAMKMIQETDLSVTNAASGKKILLLVAEKAHIQNWKDEFYKWGYESMLKYIEILTYASLHKVSGAYSAVIADEVHHLCTERRLSLIVNITFPVFIGLSATVGRDRFRALQSLYSDMKIMSLSLQKAIDSNILPDPMIYSIPLELDNINPSQEIVKTRGRKERRKVVSCSYNEMWNYLKNRLSYPDLELHVSCTEKQKYDDINSEWEFWKNKYMRSRQDFMKNKWMMAGTQRKRFLGELKSETVERFIQDRLGGKRFICFCASIEQQEILAQEGHLINSNIKDCQSIINDFNKKRFNDLYCVGMAQEGLNLNDVPTGVIIQLDAELRRFIQKVGRLLRADSPEIFIFYYKHTRDEEFLDKVKELLPDKIKEI